MDRHDFTANCVYSPVCQLRWHHGFIGSAVFVPLMIPCGSEHPTLQLEASYGYARILLHFTKHKERLIVCSLHSLDRCTKVAAFALPSLLMKACWSFCMDLLLQKQSKQEIP